MPAQSATPEATSPWTACWDDGAQAWYWWNTQTNETTWEDPKNPAFDQKRKEEAALAAAAADADADTGAAEPAATSINSANSPEPDSRPEDRHELKIDASAVEKSDTPPVEAPPEDNGDDDDDDENDKSPAPPSTTAASTTTTQPTDSSTNPSSDYYQSEEYYNWYYSQYYPYQQSYPAAYPAPEPASTASQLDKLLDTIDTKVKRKLDDAVGVRRADKTSGGDGSEQPGSSAGEAEGDGDKGAYSGGAGAGYAAPAGASAYPGQAYLQSIAGRPDYSDYTVTGAFDVRTGRMRNTADPRVADPSQYFDQASKAARQCNVFFDYERYQQERAAKRLAEEANGGPKKERRLTKKEVEMYKQKKKEKKMAHIRAKFAD